MLRRKSFEPVASSLECVKGDNAGVYRPAPYPPRIMYSPPREPMPRQYHSYCPIYPQFAMYYISTGARTLCTLWAI